MKTFFSTLYDHVVSFDNNSLLVRFFLASMVLISHTFAIYGIQEPSPLAGSHSLGWYAVNGFFFISGLLVAQSFAHRTHSQYFAARGLRILPAYIAALLIAVLLTAFFGRESVDYRFVADSAMFFIGNMLPFTAFHPGMADVWTTSAASNALNNSAWTIPFEVFCYLFIIPLLVGSMRWFIKALIALFSFYFLFQLGVFNGPDIIALDLVRTLVYFALGTSVYMALKQQKINAYTVLFFILMIGIDGSVSEVLLDIVLFAMIMLSFYYKNIFKIRNDYSYGMYIYAWPVTQAVHSQVDNLYGGIVLTYLLTYLVSVVSWHSIESPFLKLKNTLPNFISASKE